jgi:hypothetical protein
MERDRGIDKKQLFQSMKIKLTDKQVLVPQKIRKITNPQLADESSNATSVVAYEIHRWKLKRIRKLDILEIGAVMEYGGDQLTKERLTRLAAREQKLHEQYMFDEMMGRHRNQI